MGDTRRELQEMGGVEGSLAGEAGRTEAEETGAHGFPIVLRGAGGDGRWPAGGEAGTTEEGEPGIVNLSPFENKYATTKLSVLSQKTRVQYQQYL